MFSAACSQQLQIWCMFTLKWLKNKSSNSAAQSPPESNSENVTDLKILYIFLLCGKQKSSSRAKNTGLTEKDHENHTIEMSLLKVTLNIYTVMKVCVLLSHWHRELMSQLLGR